jgi:transcriptional regulator GlxA family with amidase domain
MLPYVWCAVETRNAQVCPVTIDCWIAAAVETSSVRGRKASRLVQQAETLALASVDEPLHVWALCQAIGVSERTLRKAFHRVHGVPPCRHLRMLRLSNARRALLSADGTFAKVTEIAMSFGFAELGRFSVEYKKAFGESPSQTLYRTPHARGLPRDFGAISVRGDRNLDA